MTLGWSTGRSIGNEQKKFACAHGRPSAIEYKCSLGSVDQQLESKWALSGRSTEQSIDNPNDYNFSRWRSTSRSITVWQTCLFCIKMAIFWSMLSCFGFQRLFWLKHFIFNSSIYRGYIRVFYIKSFKSFKFFKYSNL